MLTNKTIVEFLDATASCEPVPGGGSIAAQSGATAAALVEMVANLTIGRKNFEAVDEEMKEIAHKASQLRPELVKAIDQDAEAFKGVMEAYKLRKNTDEEKTVRKEQIQVSMKLAATVPLTVARMSQEIICLSREVVKKGNKNAVTDGLVSALMARTAALSAIYNVKINLESITDIDYVANISKEINEIIENVTNIERDIMQSVSL